MTFKKKSILLVLSVLIISISRPLAYGQSQPVLRYADDIDYPPYSYTIDKQLQGFTIDFARLLFRDDDYKVTYVTDNREKVYKGFADGDFDILGTVAVTEEMKGILDFSKPVGKTYVSVYTKNTMKKIALEDLKHLKVGVGRGYYTEKLLSDTLGITAYKTYGDIKQAILDLHFGDIDVVFENQDRVNEFLMVNKLRGDIIPQISGLFPVELAYGIKKGNPALLEYINGRITELEDSGGYEALYMKYFNTHSEFYYAAQNRSNFIVFGQGGVVIAGVFIFLQLYIRRLKKKLRKEHSLLQKSYEELSATYEELAATEEELKYQYDLLKTREEAVYKSEEKVHFLTFFDSLTTLPNRHLFKNHLIMALANAHRNSQIAAVLRIDMDYFKDINDTFGHAFGDSFLMGVAEKLKSNIRETDTVSRFVSDEFSILLPQIRDVKEAMDTAEKIVVSFREQWAVEGQAFYSTISVGVAVYPKDGLDEQTLLKNAGAALNSAKSLGKNNYQMYTPGMDGIISKRLELESRLKRAIEKQEFVVYYQPQINLKNNRIEGMEALVRWTDQKRGLVLPAEFIPVAEETGLIGFISEWVLRTACLQCKAWNDQGYGPLNMSVNLSASQFQQRSLKAMIERILEETGCQPQYLELEITESMAVKNMDMTVNIIHELKELGIKVSLDDFGTGYSSLNHLKIMPINTLKIDKSFIEDLGEDNNNQSAIAEAIILLAHRLKLNVIAEGVETEEQLAFLRENGCDMMQGFLFSGPLPVEGVNQLLQKN